MSAVKQFLAYGSDKKTILKASTVDIENPETGFYFHQKFHFDELFSETEYCFNVATCLNRFYEIQEDLKSFSTEQEERIVADEVHASILIKSQYKKELALTLDIT